MNSQFEFLDLITVVSFIMQLQNNSELRKQSTNDEVIEKLHNDIVGLMEENRILCNELIKQNKVIIEILGGVGNARNQDDE